jgi:60 kDa SS-A/Ro ribonucleoprotein
LRAFNLVEGYLRIQEAESASAAAAIISQFSLPRELVPTQFLTEASVWAALLPHMGLGALTRNLGNLSKCGLLAPLSSAAKLVAARFADQEEIHKSRLHPFAILLAARTYASGRSVRGHGEWTAVPQVVSALDHAFDLAFKNVEPTGRSHMLGVDVSGSMSMRIGVMTSAEAAAAMALVTARIEPEYFIGGFSTVFKDLQITATDSLPDVLRKTRDRNFGGTDTSVAIRYALDNKIEADVFVVYTDSDTWAGDEHTCESLVNYRKKTGIPAKLAVVAFTAHERTIADVADAGSMDFVGLDAALPQALAAFVRE